MDQWTIKLRTDSGTPSPYWGSLMHGMLMERLPEMWKTRLHEEGLRPFSQWVEPTGDMDFCWHVSVLDDVLAADLETILAEGQAWPCAHLKSTFSFCQIDHSHISLQAYMKPFFLNEKAASRLRLSFATTTTHKSRGEYALFPSVDLIARSLRDHLCRMEPGMVLSDDEVLEQIISHTRIARYRLQSGSFALEGARVQGYTGHVDLSIQGPDALVRLSDVLFCFAPWCGVGIKTALGMGGCRVETIEDKRSK